MGPSSEFGPAVHREPIHSEWEPVLPEPLLSAACGALSDLVTDFGTRSRETWGPVLNSEAALLYAYLGLADPCAEWRERSIEHLELAGEQLSASGQLPSALHGGLSGIGWILDHVGGLIGDGDSAGEDPIEEIDQALLLRLRRVPWNEPYDLIRGLAGIGVYFLERLPRPSAYEGLELIIRHLEQLSENSWGGTTWFTSPAHADAGQRALFPSGCFNLGVAHGVPGVAQFLGEVAAAGIEVAAAVRLLDGASGWMAARRRPPDSISRYSAIFLPGTEPADSRLAWCYGDAGIGAVFHHLACLGDSDCMSFDAIQEVKENSTAGPLGVWGRPQQITSLVDCGSPMC